MNSKVFKVFLLIFVIFTIPVIAQQEDEAQKQRLEFEQKVLEKLSERIDHFVSQLQVDEFQKEIITQKLHSYYAAQKAIFMDRSLKYFERDERLTDLNNSHFLDIKNMLSEETMSQIDVFIKDAGTTLEKDKKKKKNKKKDKKKDE